MADKYCSSCFNTGEELDEALQTALEVKRCATVFKPKIIIDTIEGTAVTCTKNGEIIKGEQYGAIWVFEFPSFGYYVFTYNDGTEQTVEGLYVDTVKEYRKMCKSDNGYCCKDEREGWASS